MDVDAATGAVLAPGALRAVREPSGSFTTLDGETYYRISAVDGMSPFLMSLASDTDLWTFVTSRGGLTAGRGDPDGSIFPYETADRLNDAHLHTGPVTVMWVRRGHRPPVRWEPFAWDAREAAPLERNLYKNVLGNRLVFEEVHRDLGLTFRYRWSGSDAFGLVRTATLVNDGTGEVSVRLLDGVRNVLPHGAPLALYQRSSSLVDAYKHTDLDPETRLAIFSLTSRVVDRAEAAESLRANVVWCHGLDPVEVCLAPEALETFRRGGPVTGERILTGRRGNYLVVSALRLDPGGRADWHLVADAARSHVEIQALRARLLGGGDLAAEIEGRLEEARDNLNRIVAGADGIQLTGRREAAAHHAANVLFNTMRGGVFAGNGEIPVADLRAFLRTRNREVAARYEPLLDGLGEAVPVCELIDAAARTGDPDLERLAHEYLPLYFGRRHGDPSRPWNRFAIHVRNPDGSKALRYEGNWRDIFQNWEALAIGFPAFLPSFIAKFVNGSTVDGFNPYRVTRDGVEWEVADPRDPWSYIGYWGDHQIIYLLKFMEALSRYAPGSLERLLERPIFSYADVPYRIKPYREVLAGPRATIDFDEERAARVASRERALGTDGRLVPGPDGDVYHVGLLEKLLVPVLAKLSNLVAGSGIWMNTQRPEWNDANNALVGAGVSVVTLCYLRRHLAFLERLVAGRGEATTPVSREVVEWARAVRTILETNRPLPAGGDRVDRQRKRLLDALGEAYSDYRARVYSSGFSGKQALAYSEVTGLLSCALEHVDPAIRANRREDGLYHAYRILELGPGGDEARTEPLEEMLEGQVAALSSGLVGPTETVSLLDSLFESRLYRADLRSFLLHPERRLPSFLERNVVPDERARAVRLVRRMLESGEGSVLAEDAFGAIRFHGDFRNAHDVAAALDRLGVEPPWSAAVAADRGAVLDLFEDVFHHRAFTGRSGAMYGYEGLGCVYWHMVAKLLLAVQEQVLRAVRERESHAVVDALKRAYFRIREGLGFEKTVLEHGAFPMDPYSHTPRHAGVQQPGMTGQVKEEILTRFGELGVRVEDGTVAFHPVLLGTDEFLAVPAVYRGVDVEGHAVGFELPPGALAFSFCQVPVVYRLTRGEPRIRLERRDGTRADLPGDRVDRASSQALFARSGEITRIEVSVPRRSLWIGQGATGNGEA